MSKCDVNYDQQDEALEVILTVFLDDLELAVYRKDSTEMKLFSENEVMQSDSLINVYLKSKLRFVTAEKTLEWDFIGKEMTEDLMAANLYFEIPDLKSLDQVRIDNQIMMELFDDQKNIIQCSIDGQNAGFFLSTHKDTEHSWKL